ncbi:MAG TPA: hypothetical protein VLM79_27170, partial [Kofleriaceae bacterium]|nr:hypothetical protein [Kofleriaceae bacterium]
MRRGELDHRDASGGGGGLDYRDAAVDGGRIDHRDASVGRSGLDPREAAGDLAAIIARAMAVALEERERVAGAPGGELRQMPTGPPPGPPARPRLASHTHLTRLVHHRRGALVLAALCAIAVGTVTGVSVRRLQAARDRAEAQQQIAERERATAEDLVRLLFYELRDRLTSISRLDLLSGVTDRVEAYYQGAGASAGRPERLQARAELYNLRAAMAASAGDGASAEQLLDQGMALLERAPAGPRADEVRAGLLEAMAVRAGRERELE